jgi:hypothetical protein
MRCNGRALSLSLTPRSEGAVLVDRSVELHQLRLEFCKRDRLQRASVLRARNTSYRLPTFRLVPDPRGVRVEWRCVVRF